MDPFITFIYILLIVSFLLYIFLWYVENKRIFAPSRKILNRYNNDIFIPPNQLHAWHFDNKGDKVILFCHGNSGNISHRSYIIDFCRNFNINLFLFDYRGYGISSGKSKIDYILEDGIDAYMYLSKMYKPEQIIVWGESLGGAVATYIASKCRCYRLLLMCTFSDIDDTIIYDSRYHPLLSYPVGFIITRLLGRLQSKEYIKYVECPIAIIHSPNDKVIPYRCAQILYESITHNNKKFITIDGDHSSPIISIDNLKEILEFCNIKMKNEEYAKSWLELLRNVWKIHQA